MNEWKNEWMNEWSEKPSQSVGTKVGRGGRGAKWDTVAWGILNVWFLEQKKENIIYYCLRTQRENLFLFLKKKKKQFAKRVGKGKRKQ